MSSSYNQNSIGKNVNFHLPEGSSIAREQIRVGIFRNNNDNEMNQGATMLHGSEDASSMYTFDYGTSSFSDDDKEGDEVGKESSYQDENEDDDDILDYGESVEVIDDKRREVHQDIQRIYEENQETKKKINLEKEHEKQIGKDKAYAMREMQSFVEGIQAEDEKVKSHQIFATNFQNTFEAKIVSRVGNIHQQDKPDESTGPHPVTPDGRGKKGRAHGVSTGVLMIQQRKHKITRLRKALLTNVEKLQMGWDKIERVKNERDRVVRIMIDQDLENTLARTNDLVQQLQQEDAENKDHYEHTLQLIAQSKDRYMGLRREYNSKRKTFKKLETAHAALVLEETHRAKKTQAMLGTKRKELEDATEKRDTVKAELKKHAAFRSAYQAHLKKKEEIKKRGDAVSKAEEELAQLKAKMQAKIDEATKSRDAADLRVQDEKAAIDAIKKITVSYDDQEDAAMKVLSRLEKKKLKLVEKIEKLTAIAEKELADDKSKLAAIEKDSKEIEVAIAEKESEKQEMVAEHEKELEDREKQTLEMNERIENCSKRVENLKKITSTDTSKEPLFRLAVLEEAVALLEQAEEFGEFNFSI